jgi:hypothetical protein
MGMCAEAVEGPCGHENQGPENEKKIRRAQGCAREWAPARSGKNGGRVD